MDGEGQAPRSSTTEPSDATTRVADSPPRTDGAGAAVGVVTEAPEEPKDEAPEVEVIERDSSIRAVLGEIIPEIALLVGAVYLFYLAGRFEGQADPGQLGPGFWPRMAATGLAIALVVRIFQTVRARNRPIVKIRSEFAEEEEVEVDWMRLAIAVALVVGYVFGTMFLGYLIATAVFLTAFIWIGGQRRWYVPLIAIAGSLISTYVFIGIVYVALPTGVGVFDTVTVEIYRLLGIQ
jgi:putative tricarboxylic transport membrane protein